MSRGSDCVSAEEEKKNYSAHKTYTESLALNDDLSWIDSLFQDKHEAPHGIRPLGWTGFGALETTGSFSISAMKPLAGGTAEVESSKFGNWTDDSAMLNEVENLRRLGVWVDYNAVPTQSLKSAPCTTIASSNIGNIYNIWQTPPNPVESLESISDALVPEPVQQQSSRYDWSTPSAIKAEIVPSCQCYWSGCSASFSSEEFRKKHIVDVYVEKDYLCGFCDQEFVTEPALKCHLDRLHPYDGADPLLKPW